MSKTVKLRPFFENSSTEKPTVGTTSVATACATRYKNTAHTHACIRRELARIHVAGITLRSLSWDTEDKGHLAASPPLCFHGRRLFTFFGLRCAMMVDFPELSRPTTTIRCFWPPVALRPKSI